MAYTNHEFCWHGIVSTNLDEAKRFYPNVVGWTVQTMPMGDAEATMFAAGGIPRAHLMEPPIEGLPSHWENSLRVEDLDAATAAAVANGGTQMVPPTDIPVGRFSVVTSPSGAVVSLYHEGDGDSKNAPGGPGAIHWTELHSTALDADLAWLKKTFGYTTTEMAMPNGDTYYVLMNGEESAAGAMKAMNPAAPSMWMSWVHVEDIDAAVVRAAEFGGQVFGEIMEMPNVGRMCVVADSTGGVFGMITPSPK